MTNDFSGNVVSKSLLNNPIRMLALIIVVAVLVAVGFSILNATYKGLGSDGVTFTDSFPVTDPSVDQIVTLTHSPDSSTVVVQQYNGFQWLTVGNAFVAVSGTQVTVGSGGLQG